MDLQRHTTTRKVNRARLDDMLKEATGNTDMDTVGYLLSEIDGKLSHLNDLDKAIADITPVDSLATELMETASYMEHARRLSYAVYRSYCDTIPDQNAPARSRSSPRSGGTKRPTLKLPSCDGDPLKWTNFWQSFEAEIHLDDSL